jgi:hypothetical protein
MNGVYTNIAKKRAEQSKEPVTQGSIPPPPEKPVVQVMQAKKRDAHKPENPQESETVALACSP